MDGRAGAMSRMNGANGVNGVRAMSGMFGVSDQVLQAAGAGLVLCLLGWAAWRLTDLDAAMRRREGLFPRPPRTRGARGRLLRRVLRRRVKPPPELLLLPVGLLAAWPTHSPLVAAAAAAAVLPAIRLRRSRRAARAREQRRQAVVGLCAALAGELRTGATPHQAAESVSGELTVPEAPLDCTVLLAAVRFGGSVPEAFRVLAELPGAEGAMGIAACWQVASSSGAGLSAGLDRVAEGLRAERALYETVRAELAGPRSTAALLAALPLFGLLLGAGLGADPLRMLLHTPSGLVCLGLGALLECAGIGWIGRIARGAEPAR